MKYNDNGTYKDIYVKSFDTLPVGTEVDYDGSVVPSGWTEVVDPNTYSTDEVKIGTWIDGKPLYRKTIYSTTTSGSLGLSNIDFLRFKDFNANIDTSSLLLPDGRYINSSDNLDFYIDKSNNFFSLTLGTAWVNKFNWLVFDMEYTKTTD